MITIKPFTVSICCFNNGAIFAQFSAQFPLLSLLVYSTLEPSPLLVDLCDLLDITN